MNKKINKVPLTKKDIKFLKKYRKEAIIIIVAFWIGTHIVLLLDGLIYDYKQTFWSPFWIEIPIFTIAFFILVVTLQIQIWRKFKFETIGKVDRIVTTANKAKLYVRKAMIARYGVTTKFAMLVNGKYYPVPDENKINIKKGQEIKIGFMKFPKKIISIDVT